MKVARENNAIPDPRVSVVIPHLNEPDDLQRCLVCLAEQKAAGIPFEIVVVDNGSRRLPTEICGAYDNVRLEREPVPGPGPARSRGASLARGDIVAFIDADCLAAPGWLRAIVDHFDRHPEVHVIAGDVQVSRQDREAPTMFEVYESIFSYLIPIYVSRDNYAATGNMAVRRDVFHAVGPFGGIGIAEDREWGQRAVKLGYRIAYVPEVVVKTPACKSFTELAKRWDRAIAHDFEDAKSGKSWLLNWLATSAMVAASPPLELPRIMRSGKAKNLREVWLAFACLTRIRLYRAARMLSQASHGRARASLLRWNRE